MLMWSFWIVFVLCGVGGGGGGGGGGGEGSKTESLVLALGHVSYKDDATWCKP